MKTIKKKKKKKATASLAKHVWPCTTPIRETLTFCRTLRTQGGVNKVKDVGSDMADTVSGATRKLPPNFLPFVGVVLLLSFLPSLFALVGSLFSGQ
jgi:hypothetical protein